MPTGRDGNDLGSVLAWVNEFALVTGRPEFTRAEGRYVLNAHNALLRTYPKNTTQFHPGGITKLESIYSEADRLRKEAAAPAAVPETAPAVA